MDTKRYTFAEMCRDVRSDARTCGAGSWLGVLVTLLWGTAFQLLFGYRLSRWLAGVHLEILYVPIKWLQYAVCGSEISPRAVLGRGVHFPHPVGIVIGAGGVVEDDVWIFQQVTIGSHGRRGEDKRYPLVCRGVRIYAGAKVIGGVRIGNGAMVGANSVVLQDVPDGATVAGVPARVIET